LTNDIAMMDDENYSTAGNGNTHQPLQDNKSGDNGKIAPKKAGKKAVSKVVPQTEKVAPPKEVVKETPKKASPKKALPKKTENVQPSAAEPAVEEAPLKSIKAKKATTPKQPVEKPASRKVAAKKAKAVTPPQFEASQTVEHPAPQEQTDVAEQSTTQESFEAAAPPVQQDSEAVQTPASTENIEAVEAIATEPVSEPDAEATVAIRETDVEAPAPTVADTVVTSRLRKVTFQIKFQTVLGESLFVTGNHPLLGNNNIDNAFPLTYLNENYWYGTMEIAEEEPLTADISYNYLLRKVDGSTSQEWGNDKIISPSKVAVENLFLIDTWNAAAAVENTYYSEPFQQVLLCENFTEVSSTKPDKVTHTFRAKAPLLPKGQVLCIVGSIEELAEWNTSNSLLLSRQQDEVWNTISLDLSDANFPVAYKYGIYDVEKSAFISYETGLNRVLYDGAGEDKLTVVSDNFANIPFSGFKGAGVAIPVFSLKSEKSFGVGEFSDLKLMVDWAKHVGLKLVQLLPVNDTTATHTYADSYPYAAISAFALHPLYLHLPSIINKDNQQLLLNLEEKRLELNNKAAVDYVSVMAAKWDLIKQVFPVQKQATFASEDFNSFFKENKHWLVPYAAFSYFREKFNTSDFNTWPTNQSFNADEINALAAAPMDAEDALSVYYYVQYHLHLQLKDAATYAHENGIILKGDIPIGIYRNSCDAWQEPELFNMDMQAGAPPDDFAVKGQNWGFPTYNWQKMREDGFLWWKKRFNQMSHYFDAFRIDHILGFFRIWSIPMNAVEGIMGHFVPAMPVHVNEIAGRGIYFNYDRFCKPFINDAILWDTFRADTEMVKSQFLDAGNEGQYTLKPAFDTQRKVETHFAQLESTEQYRQIKEGLYDLISNVILFEEEGSGAEHFHFRITMNTTASFKYLDGHTQGQLSELYTNYFYRRQDNYWEKEAMMKLPELKRSTNMLICGEDLGMVPDCVPGVMKELAILSLEIQRMPKDPTREFFHPNDAPYLSVVTPSTHDMSTIRGWWEEDRAATQRFFVTELGQWGTAPYFCEPWINRIIVLQHLYSPAMWSIFQLQDLLGISASLRRENPNEERINIPAIPNYYWRYRMHLPLEKLLEETEFITELRGYVAQSGRV
jgi:4-alpha-glucanotransferase